MALLRFFAHGWRQETLTQNAAAVRQDGDELYSRTGTALQHMTKFGRHLSQTVTAFNLFVGSVDSRLLPSLRRMHEHGIGERELEPPAPIDLAVRGLRPGWVDEHEAGQTDDDKIVIGVGDPDPAPADTSPAELAQTNGWHGGDYVQGCDSGDGRLEFPRISFDIEADLDLGPAPEPTLPSVSNEAAEASDPLSDGLSAREWFEEDSQSVPEDGTAPATSVTQGVVNCADHVHAGHLAHMAGLSPNSLGPYESVGKLPYRAGWCRASRENYWENGTAAKWLDQRGYLNSIHGGAAEFIARYLPPPG
jgi:hypothetical protein